MSVWLVDSDRDCTRVMGIWTIPEDPGMPPESYYPLELERQRGVFAMAAKGSDPTWADWADQLEEEAPYFHWWWQAELPAATILDAYHMAVKALQPAA